MPFFYGDVNGDGTLGTKDLSQIISHVNGNISLTGDDFLRADINNDGVLDEKDLNALGETLVETESLSTYYDPNEISGEFRFQLLTSNAQNIESNLPVINNDNSFTKLETAIFSSALNTTLSPVVPKTTM